jgi:hypothetical protein
MDAQTQASEVRLWRQFDFPIMVDMSHRPDIWAGSAGQLASYPVDVPLALQEMDLLVRFGLSGADGRAVSSCRGNDSDRQEASELLDLSTRAALSKNPWSALPVIMPRFWRWVARTHPNAYRGIMPLLPNTGNTADLERDMSIFSRKIVPCTVGRMGNALIRGLAVASANPVLYRRLAAKLYNHISDPDRGFAPALPVPYAAVDNPESPDDELFDVWDEAAHADELAIIFTLGLIPLDEVSAAEFLAALRSMHSRGGAFPAGVA